MIRVDGEETEAKRQGNETAVAQDCTHKNTELVPGYTSSNARLLN